MEGCRGGGRGCGAGKGSDEAYMDDDEHDAGGDAEVYNQSTSKRFDGFVSFLSATSKGFDDFAFGSVLLI